MLQWHKCCTCITVRVCDYLRFCCVTILNLMYLSIDTVILPFFPSSTLNRAVVMLRFCLIDLKLQLIAEFVKNHTICKKLRKLKWNICFNLRFFATNWNDVSSRLLILCNGAITLWPQNASDRTIWGKSHNL